LKSSLDGIVYCIARAADAIVFSVCLCEREGEKWDARIVELRGRRLSDRQIDAQKIGIGTSQGWVSMFVSFL